MNVFVHTPYSIVHWSICALLMLFPQTLKWHHHSSIDEGVVLVGCTGLRISVGRYIDTSINLDNCY